MVKSDTERSKNDIRMTKTAGPLLAGMTLKVIIDPDEDSGFIVHVPALRGCWSQGRTRDEALSNIREAIAGWLEVEQDKSEQPAAPADVDVA